MENTQTTAKAPKIKLDFKDSKYATGRRKTSIAKVWLKKGSGKIYVNGKLFSDYFSSDNHKMQIVRPFELINQATEYDVKCSVKGGGPTGQAGAMVHGISKALVLFDEKLKSTLKTEKLTTRDSKSVAPSPTTTSVSYLYCCLNLARHGIQKGRTVNSAMCSG